MTTPSGGSPLWRVIGLLDHVRKSGTGYEARCPGPRHHNEDRHPSLSVGVGLDGRVLLDCKAGCETAEVLAALNLGLGDLFEKSPAGYPVRRFQLVNGNGHVVATHVREDLPEDKLVHWESRGRNGLNGVKTADLPLYRAPDLATSTTGPVILCEGEKATQALVDVGVLAVGTVTGAGATPSTATLAPLQGREVWLWPDNDDEGRRHMERIAQQIKPTPRWICWPAAPPKGDAADYVAAGGDAAGIFKLLVPLGSGGPKIWTGPELAAMAFDAPQWAIPELLPAGLSILAGRPKLGKSWLALGWALDIPRPSLTLKKLKVVKGETLYLALEDGPRRIQERMALLLGDEKAPEGFYVVTEWLRMNEGGLDALSDWLTKHPRARLVVIDTFKRVRPLEKNTQRLYDMDYDAIAPMAELARRHNVAIVLVFHTRKMQSDDPLEMVSGTLGVSGAADCVLVLRRERGQADASLFVTGRDVEEQDLALRWEKDDILGWELLGNADDFRRSKERQDVLDSIATMPGMTPSEIAETVDKSRGGVRKLLFFMVRDGEVRTREGRYYPIGNSGNAFPSRARSREVTGNSGNSASQSVTANPSVANGTVTGPVTPATAVPPATPVTAVTAHDTAPIKPTLSPGNTRGAVCRKCARPRAAHIAEPDLCEWEP